MPLHTDDALSHWESSFMADESPKATSVHVVSLYLEYFKSVSIQKPAHRSQRIVFQMFMTNVIETIVFQHSCQIILLNNPHPIGSQDASDVRHETVWVL